MSGAVNSEYEYTTLRKKLHLYGYTQHFPPQAFQLVEALFQDVIAVSKNLFNSQLKIATLIEDRCSEVDKEIYYCTHCGRHDLNTKIKVDCVNHNRSLSKSMMGIKRQSKPCDSKLRSFAFDGGIEDFVVRRTKVNRNCNKHTKKPFVTTVPLGVYLQKPNKSRYQQKRSFSCTNCNLQVKSLISMTEEDKPCNSKSNEKYLGETMDKCNSSRQDSRLDSEENYCNKCKNGLQSKSTSKAHLRTIGCNTDCVAVPCIYTHAHTYDDILWGNGRIVDGEKYCTQHLNTLNGPQNSIFHSNDPIQCKQANKDPMYSWWCSNW